MQAHWTSLLPPIIVLISACFTRKLNSSLLTGVISAALIYTNANLKNTISTIMNRFWEQLSDADNLYLYSFLLFVGIIIILIGRSGGALAFAKTVTHKLKQKKDVESASLAISALLFIDDYLSNLTVGYVMRPLSDSFKIPRVKLAYLVHSLSGPLVILAPISSWVAMITSQLEEAGIGIEKTINANPFFVYLESIPFVFYSYLLFLSLIIIVRRSISFGPMQYHEQEANKTGNMFGGKLAKKDVVPLIEINHASIIDSIFPLGFLIASVFFGLAYMGGFWLFGGSSSLFQAFQDNTHIFFILGLSSFLAICISIIFSLYRKTIKPNAVWPIVQEGTQLMYPAVIMVFLASTLGVILRSDLHTGTYLAHSFMHAVPIALLPLLIFLVSTIIATITGSSWGTIALMLPITIEMLINLLGIQESVTPTDIAILFPILGAIFSGAVCGDHISPISETTIMASTSTGSYPLDHSYTQIFYVIPVIVGTAFAFLLSGYCIQYGFWQTVILSLLVGGTICSSLIYIFKKTLQNKRKLTT